MKKIKQGDIITGIDNNNKTVEIIERNQNYCFLKCTDSGNRSLWNTGNIWIDGKDEALQVGTINDPDHYKRTREDLYSVFQKNIADRDARDERKAFKESEANVNFEKNNTFANRINEAHEIRIVSIARLRDLIQEIGSTEKLLKDKEGKALLEQVSLINTLFTYRNSLTF